MFRITHSTPASIALPASKAPPQACPGPVAATERDAVLLRTFGPEPLEAGFRTWVEGHAKADVVVVGCQGRGSEPVAVPLDAALRVLSTSTRPLAPARGESLGLPADVTLGAAATALLQAYEDPDGPRCRSFRSATYFLIGLAHLAADEHLEGESADVSGRARGREAARA
jgi:hypothetical protein